MRTTCCLIAFSVVLTSLAAGDESGRAGTLESIIDLQINEQLAAKQLAIAEACSDAEFVRRIHLDLTGCIPSATVARDFLSSSAAKKRLNLIDRLLCSDAFARHMAIVFDVMLMERRPDKHVTTGEWRGYLAKSFAEEKPLNVLFREILGADGVDDQLRPAAKFYLDRAVDKDTLVRDIGRLMLGVNLQCAQCHDHPDINGYLHQHYHGLSVFVAGSSTFREKDGRFVLQEAAVREVEFSSVFNPETSNTTGPRLIDALLEIPEFAEGEEYVEKPSRTVRSVPRFSLRALLAQRLPSHETPEFSRNMSNRLWAMMMGRGLVHPLDMHHADNPPSHPELLDALAARLRSSGYDVKSFLRGIALSDAYQRSSLLPVGIDPDSLPVETYAVANMKGLSPEQLFESLLMATRSHAILERQIDEALAETHSAGDPTESGEAALSAVRTAKRFEQVANFVTVFGSVPGQPQSEFSASLPQALYLANSEAVAEWVPPRLGNLSDRLVTLVAAESIARELYLNVLSRVPTAEEISVVEEELDFAEPELRRARVAALVWSLIASAEFRLNH